MDPSTVLASDAAASLRPIIGGRLIVGGKHKASVRYTGTVEGQPGEWVGLEWDDPSRGKHSGIHDGRHYFDCAPGCGSFVRLPKLLATADAGRSLAKAVAERYDPSAATEHGHGMFVSTASHRRVHVELVGADQAAARLATEGRLQQASLVDMRISSLGMTGATCSFLCRVSSMDLSCNLISDWHFVLGLAAALPSLSTLNLSGNRLHFPPTALATVSASSAPPSAPPHQALTNLQTLVLNNCGVTWQHAVSACCSLPALTELRLCGNNLASLGLSAEFAANLSAALPQLRTLDLEVNALEHWDDIAGLQHLPSLQALLLSGNQLQRVTYPGGFSSLTSLMLGGNRIASWQAVDALDQFPALLEARLSENPATAADPGAARYEAIARVGRLAALNGSCIGHPERWDAELNYLRQVIDQLAALPPEDGTAAGGGSDRNAVLQEHPRFGTLSTKYGSLAPSVPAGGGGSSLAKSMVEAVLAFGGKEVRKKLPVNLTVGRLKLLTEKLLRVKAAQQALILMPTAPESGGGSAAEPEDITHDDARELRYYGMGDGCRIEVSEIEPEARAAARRRARAAAAALHELRMERHEQGLQQLRAEEERLMA